MRNQDRSLAEMDKEILRPTANFADAPVRQSLGKIRCEGEPKVCAPKFDLANEGAFKNRLQSAADCLDFWQFRHRER